MTWPVLHSSSLHPDHREDLEDVEFRLSPLNCVNNNLYTFPNRSSFSLNEETKMKVCLVSVSPIRSGTPGSRACPAGPQQTDA